MARKYELITELYKQTLREVSSRPTSWTAFLRSACRNYRLPFDELLLIYAQRRTPPPYCQSTAQRAGTSGLVDG